MANRLSQERSPYLLQHADNPVDWYPWGEEAFDKARREDKPVFLSIGYATCHWCHVMAEESFANEAVARVLNRDYVAVKVDREERPDVDAVYMKACVALNGSGGWPLTVLMTPQQEPFFAGTYLPRENRGGRMGLLPLLQAVAARWKGDRASLLRAGEEITALLRREAPAAGAPEPELARACAQMLRDSHDAAFGGFGTAPKFPTPHKLLFLLRWAALSGEKDARAIAEQTLRQMARGGIYDHIGGGFARYATDREWLAPHFEKTLYDNALLALCYTEAWQEGHYALYRRVAEETLGYCLRELRHPKGGYCSGQDADSGGEEGKFYLWTPGEVADVLGADEGRHFCECYDITPEGNFHGKSIPNLLLNDRWNLLPVGYAAYRERLRARRAERCELRRDEKRLTAWNGMLLMALARAGAVFGEARWAEAARELGRWLLETAGAAAPESLRAVCYEGDARFPAQLDDYAFAALGLLELYRLDYDSGLLLRAEGLAKEILRHFAAPGGGFARSSDRAESLIARPVEVVDGAAPSGNSAAALLFTQLFRLSGREEWRAAAERQLGFLCARIRPYPGEAAFGCIALLDWLFETRELVCAAAEPPAALAAVTARYAPELTVLLRRPEDELLPVFAPFTAACAMRDGRPTFYPCRGGVCELPYTL